MEINKLKRRHKIHNRIREKIRNTTNKPRLIVYRSLKHNYAQLLDDKEGKILASASDVKLKSGAKKEKAKQVGIDIAKKALEKNISSCVFDRNGWKYHGRVKEIADGARSEGLKF